MHTGMRGKRSFPFIIDGIMSAIIYPLLYPAAKAWRVSKGTEQSSL